MFNEESCPCSMTINLMTLNSKEKGVLVILDESKGVILILWGWGLGLVDSAWRWTTRIMIWENRLFMIIRV